VPWSPLGQGFLTGTVGRGESFSDNDIRSRFPHFSPEALEANQPIVDLVKEIADRTEATPAQVALAWPLAKSPNIVPIPGTRKIERLRERPPRSPPPPDEVEEIDPRSTHFTVIGARGGGHSKTSPATAQSSATSWASTRASRIERHSRPDRGHCRAVTASRSSARSDDLVAAVKIGSAGCAG
jgi:hypothetical protein